MEEDQLTVTLRMLAEGQQMLTDILSQLDKLPAERNIKVNVVSDTGTDGLAGAEEGVTDSVDAMNKSMMTMPAVAEQTSAKVSESMGSTGMGGAFSETRSNLNSLTGGMMGFLPLMAGMSLVSATGQFDALAKSIQSFKVISGTSAETASKWVGVANIYGISINSLSMAMKGLEQHQESLQTTFSKTTGSGVAASIAMDKLTVANDEYSIAQQKIVTDQEKVNKAIDEYGKNSIKAQTATQSLETAQVHLITTQAGILRAQDDYNKATGQTNDQLSTLQLAAQRLGITLINNKGQMTSQTQILMEMADAYTRTGGSVQTVADITAILGGRAKAVLPLFAEGSQGIQDAMTQTEQAGLVMNQQQLSVGVAAGKTMSDIKENIKSLFVGIGSDLLPVFDFVDAHVKTFVDIAGAALAIFAAVKLWKVGAGFVSDIGKLYSSITGISGSAGSILSKVTGSGGGGSSAAQKIIGMQVTVAVFGEAAFAQLKEASGGSGLPGGGKGNGLAGDAETAAEDGAPVVGAGALAEGGVDASVLGGVLGAGTIATIAAAVVPVAALGAIGYFGISSIVAEWKKPQSVQNADIAKVRASIGVTNTGSDPMLYGLNDPFAPAIKAMKVSQDQAAAEWNTIDMLSKSTGGEYDMFYAQLQGELKGTLQSGSNVQAATDDAARLMKAGVIKNAPQMQQWEDNWNLIQLGTGKNASWSEQLATQMELAGTLTAQNAPEYVTAFNALVNQGMNPAAITAVNIANELALTAAITANLHQTAAQINSSATQTTADFNLLMGGEHNRAPIKSGSGSTKLAAGGVLSEEIFGIGLRSGGTYSINEEGGEAVVPLGKSGGSSSPLPVSSAGGGGGGGGVVVQISFPNSLTFLNNANQIDELARAIESRLATVRLPHRGVRMSPH